VALVREQSGGGSGGERISFSRVLRPRFASRPRRPARQQATPPTFTAVVYRPLSAGTGLHRCHLGTGYKITLPCTSCCPSPLEIRMGGAKRHSSEEAASDADSDFANGDNKEGGRGDLPGSLEPTSSDPARSHLSRSSQEPGEWGVILTAAFGPSILDGFPLANNSIALDAGCPCPLSLFHGDGGW